MARNFLDEDPPPKGLTFKDGFRFGMGFAIAWVISMATIGLVIAGTLAIVK